MSRLSLEDEFTDEVFTRGRAAWWNSFNVPGVNFLSNRIFCLSLNARAM